MIKMSEYAERRKQLMQKVGQNSIVILPAAQAALRNNDCFYPYRQESNFYYLTGFNEPDAILVLAPGRQEGEYILFNRPRDPDMEIWDGPRAGQEGARDIFLADQSFPITEWQARCPELLAGRETIHYPLGFNKGFDNTLITAVKSLRSKVRQGVVCPMTFTDVAPTIHEMRLFKSEGELQLIRKAIEITEKAHIEAIKKTRPGLYEYELEAMLNYVFQKQGARATAYSSIVGAGKNSCVLHYINNNEVIQANDLVLIDAGAEYENYAADITRTFPANGRFSTEQRLIYELVLASQQAGIESIKPNAKWGDAQTVIISVLTQGLIDLGLLKGRLDDLIEKKAYSPFYMHFSGHWMGLDVHDVGRYRIDEEWRKLAPGMVFTVEPGLYISAHLPVDKRWHNIGVRIEDDILVTSKGYEVLSPNIPKQVADIEAMMAT